MARSVGTRPRSTSPSAQKKGQPWSEAEHMAFLAGLEKFGKGNWRGIARYFCPARTPTQVASHAQKYFLRCDGLTKRRSRFSTVEEQAAVANMSLPDSGTAVSTGLFAFPYGTWGFPAQPTCNFSEYLMATSLSPVAATEGCTWRAAPAFPGVPKVASQLTVTARDGPVQFTRICRPRAFPAEFRKDTLQKLREGMVSIVPVEKANSTLHPSAHSAFRPLASSPIQV